MPSITKRATLAGALALAASLLGPALPASAADLEIAHAQGTTTVPENPGTVLVFDLAALDTLDALGVEPAGVPAGIKPGYLSKYDGEDYARIGSLFEPDYEAVAAASPDLIIVGGRSAAKYRELSGIAPTIDVSVDYGDFIRNAEDRIRTLADIFDKRQEAEAKLETLDASISDLREKAENAGTGLIILTTGGRMSAYGPGSRFGVIHTALGLQAAAPDLDVATHGQAISYEFILETNPDYLFVIDRDAAIGQQGQAAAAMLDNDIIHKTKAWKDGHIVYLQPDYWYLSGTGLYAMQAMVNELATALD